RPALLPVLGVQRADLRLQPYLHDSRRLQPTLRPGSSTREDLPAAALPLTQTTTPFPAPATPRRGLPLPAAVTAANTGQRVNRCQPPCTWTRRPSPRADAALVRCPCPGVAQAASSGVRALIDRAWISVSIMSPSAA